ncbi:MAG TPA: TetR/AcrR family transcriptional regulator, partial [Dehalococcoidia bacterium]|nr:TetR/AcrR family transcriptional regulator [Dehalococcoidia bacterium]
MAPRAYRSTKRAEAVEGTRRRITEAVVQLHREQGVIATTYDDIARRADVAPATVYRHFPTVGDLIPACGARILEITSPPGPAIFDGKKTPAERLRVLVDELFGFWVRAESWLNVGRCEAAKVPALAADLRNWDWAIRGLVGAALGEGVGDQAVSLVKAMTDFYTWKALAAEGLRDEAP